MTESRLGTPAKWTAVTAILWECHQVRDLRAKEHNVLDLVPPTLMIYWGTATLSVRNRTDLPARRF
jgi:hypothetical protein